MCKEEKVGRNLATSFQRLVEGNPRRGQAVCVLITEVSGFLEGELPLGVSSISKSLNRSRVTCFCNKRT